MKNSLIAIWLICASLAILPTDIAAAIRQAEASTFHSKQIEEMKPSKMAGEELGKFDRKRQRIERRMAKRLSKMEIGMPRGKLLTALILMVAAILVFATGQFLVVGALFSIVGSVAIIAALLFFILWLMERSPQPRPTD
jgi:Flp pilus assembly protein TadB